jgi:signal transduction histidine kinase
MTFRRQLIVGQIASALVIVVTALTAILALRATTDNVESVTQRFAASSDIVQQLPLRAEQLVATSRGLLLTGHDQYRRRFDALDAELEGSLRRLEITAATAGNTQLIAVQRDAAEYVAAVSRAAHERAETGDLRQIVELFDDELAPRRAAFERSVAEFARDEQTRLDSSLKHAERLTHRVQITLAFAAAIAIAIGVVLASVVQRRLASQFERVQAANVVATRAAAAHKELLAIVSHDLRNPLNAIVLGAGLLRETHRGERHVETIANAAERMQHLIEELVDVARIETGAVQLRTERFEVGRALELAIGMFADAAKQRSVRLRAASSVAWVCADRERILQVLSNLIANALRFVSPGGDIDVTAARAGDRVRFAVADTGPGILDEDAAHVFDRHWRGAAGAQRAGLGLGLFICKGLVEAHRGRIGLDSCLGKGATFWFELPAELEG